MGRLDQRLQRCASPLLDHLLVLLVTYASPPGAAVERVQAFLPASTEAYDGAVDVLGESDPLTLGIARDDCLVPERERAVDQRLDRPGLSRAVGPEHDDVGAERAAWRLVL